MKTKNLLFATLMLCSTFAFSQNVGINATGAAPANSAGLDVNFTDRGVLIPRVSLTAINSAGPISSPTTSLLVYNTATAGTGVNQVTPGYYYWYAGNWVRILGGAEADGKYWNLKGNSGTDPNADFLGTTDNVVLRFRTNNTNQLEITTAGRIHPYQDGTAAAPTYSFRGGPNNGMYRETGTLNWAIGGVERLRLGSSYLRTSFLGSAAAPAYSFLDYTNTGMYAGTDMLRWSVSGGERLRLGTNYLRTIFNGTAAVPAYSFTNNANIGMFRAGSGILGFSTSGAERMRILANGNVGIGTTNPLQKLHVAGGNFRLDGAFMPNNDAGLTGRVLLSSGAGAAPTWGPDLGNITEISRWVYPATGSIYISPGKHILTALVPPGVNVSPSTSAVVTIRGDWPSAPLVDIEHVEARTNEIRFVVYNYGGVNYTNMDFSIVIIK